MASTAPIQALPAHARTAQNAPAAPSRGVPGGFGHALAQALAVPEPAGSTVPAIPAPTEAAAPPAQALPALPAVAATPRADPAAVNPGKPVKGKPAAPAAETEEDKPSVEAAKPSEKLQEPAPSQPILPTPLQAAPTVAQPITLPSKAGDALPSTEQDDSAAPVAGIGGHQQLPSASAPAAAQEDTPSAEAAGSSEKLQATAPFQPVLPVPPQATPPAVALPSKVGNAVPSTEQDSSTTPVASTDGRQPAPSAPVPATAQTTAPPASAPPSHAAAPSDAGDTAAHAVQKHPPAATAEKEPSAALSAIPAEAAPLPPVASAPLPSAAPAPLGAPHPAPAPSQAPARAAAADKPAPPSAAVQVGPVLASFAAGAAHSGAPQHLTIRLDPTDLGRVQVRIERSPDGSARVDLKVEKPDTLLLLLRDQPQLHRALDLAGVPSAERTLQFHLAPPDATAPGGMAAQPNADGGHGHGQHRPGQPHSGRFAAHGAAPFLDDATPGPAAFRRAGVDITA